MKGNKYSERATPAKVIIKILHGCVFQSIVTQLYYVHFIKQHALKRQEQLLPQIDKKCLNNRKCSEERKRWTEPAEEPEAERNICTVCEEVY